MSRRRKPPVLVQQENRPGGAADRILLWNVPWTPFSFDLFQFPSGFPDNPGHIPFVVRLHLEPDEVNFAS